METGSSPSDPLFWLHHATIDRLWAKWQKQHPGVLCAVHPDRPFDFSEKAYWLQRDVALKAFVDQWLHVSTEDGSYQKIYSAWFD